MDREQVRRWEAQCIQEQAPACTAACPVHVDARKLVECVSRGDFQGGLAALANAVPLPRILAHVCDHPCQAQCKRAEAGEAIGIGLLERACAEFGAPAPAVRAQVSRNQSVAVVGGGLSGVAATIGLASRGYAVTLFEARPRLLDRLRSLDERVLPAHAIDADLAVLDLLQVAVRHEKPILNSIVQEFDALYLAPGPEPFHDDSLGLALGVQGRIQIDPLTLATSHAKIFAGGAQRYSLAAYSPIQSLADGNYSAVSIDRFLQGASLGAHRENQGAYPSRLYVNTKRYAASSATHRSGDAAGYSEEEAQQEAGRCFPCQCLECVRVCMYLEEYGSYPKSYVRQIYNNECIVMGVRQANRMINSCALCGLCTAVCPEDFSMADVILDARRSMVKSGKMPPTAHDFALRDMAFSQSEAFTLAHHQPGFQSSRTAFLPGCQLSASSPDHVASSYEVLRNTIDGGVGLILQCCGAPALWAGNDEKFQQAINTLESAWQAMGKPRLITACSSCYRVLHDHLPQISVEPLWPHLHAGIAPNAPPRQASRTVAIHDPCSTRGVSEVEGSARALLAELGVTAVELNEPGLTTCCGYGGLMLFANPELAAKTVTRRANESNADYVTYCAMCRDRFAHHGKRTIHILDLVFSNGNSDTAARPDPGFSRRQENRAQLKNRLLREVWGEQGSSMESSIALHISEEVRALLEERMILVEDVRRTIAHAEQTGDKIENPAIGRTVASFRPVSVTYWVEYSPEGGGFAVHNAYSHRMEVR
ncbi:MAG: pyridine nucleotide-disulfide oxidoreductase/dicluster-binding protein [Terracidiphilus sp.]|jgi:Fe-S oxidoreductase